MQNLNQQDNMEGYSALDKNRWSAINYSIEVTRVKSDADFMRKENFSKEICNLFDRLQQIADNLSNDEKIKCGARRTIADIALKVNIERKETILDKLYKYINIDIRLFEEISEILRHNFSDFTMIIPALKGYQLADEVDKHLHNAKLDCLYLKNDTHERFVVGNDLEGITFESILKDTKRHYDKLGGIKRIEQEVKCGSDITMYTNSKEREEEVLWMEVKSRFTD